MIFSIENFSLEFHVSVVLLPGDRRSFTLARFVFVPHLLWPGPFTRIRNDLGCGDVKWKKKAKITKTITIKRLRLIRN